MTNFISDDDIKILSNESTSYENPGNEIEIKQVTKFLINTDYVKKSIFKNSVFKWVISVYKDIEQGCNHPVIISSNLHVVWRLKRATVFYMTMNPCVEDDLDDLEICCSDMSKFIPMFVIKQILCRQPGFISYKPYLDSYIQNSLPFDPEDLTLENTIKQQNLDRNYFMYCVLSMNSSGQIKKSYDDTTIVR